MLILQVDARLRVLPSIEKIKRKVLSFGCEKMSIERETWEKVLIAIERMANILFTLMLMTIAWGIYQLILENFMVT